MTFLKYSKLISSSFFEASKASGAGELVLDGDSKGVEEVEERFVELFSDLIQ